MGRAIGAILSGRDRVLREARALFIERGFAEVSMQQIADAAAMTKAALYYHFRDKEDLFAQVVLREMYRQRQRIQEQCQPDGSLQSQVERLVRLYFDQTSPDVLRMMYDFRKNVPEQRHDEVHKELERFVATISAIFERAAQSGELRDIPPKLAAYVFFHTVMAVLNLHYHDPSLMPLDPGSGSRIVSEIVLHGIASTRAADEPSQQVKPAD